jgi:hypothetical protein
LHHDIVIIGRAAVAPLPGAFAPRLAPVLTRIGRLAQEFLRASAIALRRHSAPPPRDALESALDDYLSGINLMRGEGLTIKLSIEEAERYLRSASRRSKCGTISSTLNAAFASRPDFRAGDEAQY